ncbi:uncharacterized protein DSM5745_10445 [Aspergillus mulundensis]|uniref:AttH domain-containing protein n=1 Tax=Aspergillus mulundensis TaxID=1810919 RepID=A0A3D8QIX0_9EURO|nr:hypothetical protein DSM5745_10445 [Aspergillus mulundensis]RDW61773.1 hypothetical protein DSM5745_10445 [Aspergillus mulundensis]
MHHRIHWAMAPVLNILLLSLLFTFQHPTTWQARAQTEMLALHQQPQMAMPMPQSLQSAPQPFSELPVPITDPSPSPPSCTHSNTTAFALSSPDAPIPFLTSKDDDKNKPMHPALPRLPTPTNTTAWEQWFFEGVSSSGKAGFVLSFSRDATYAFFGRGNLRVEFYLVFEDGSVLQELDFAAESGLAWGACRPGGNGNSGNGSMVEGVWRAGRGRGRDWDREYAFSIDTQTGEAQVRFDTPRASGVVEFAAPASSLGPAPGPETETETALHLPLFTLAPTARSTTFTMTMTMALSPGKKISYAGSGSHMHMWAAAGLLKVTEGFHIVRGRAGPFEFAFWEFASRVWAGVGFVRAWVSRDGVVVAEVRATAAAAAGAATGGNEYCDAVSGDCVSLKPITGFAGYGTPGGLPGSGGSSSKTTGHALRFTTSENRSYAFDVEHANRHFGMALGGPYGAVGFTNRVLGGDGEGSVYVGSAWSEEARFPEELARWRVWVVFGIGMLGRVWEGVWGGLGRA